MYFVRLILALLSLFFLLNETSWSETTGETYELGLVLSFIPLGDTEPLGKMIDKNTTFNAHSFMKSQPLVKYSKMPHWLRWQGYYRAENTGIHMFVFSGGSHYTDCKFEANLAGNKLFSVSGNNLGLLFGHKTVDLEKGIHSLEAILSCRNYDKAFGAIEVKRPGESIVGKMKATGLLHLR